MHALAFCRCACDIHVVCLLYVCTLCDVHRACGWRLFAGALGARVIGSCGYHTATMGARRE